MDYYINFNCFVCNEYNRNSFLQILIRTFFIFVLFDLFFHVRLFIAARLTFHVPFDCYNDVYLGLKLIENCFPININHLTALNFEFPSDWIGSGTKSIGYRANAFEILMNYYNTCQLTIFYRSAHRNPKINLTIVPPVVFREKRLYVLIEVTSLIFFKNAQTAQKQFKFPLIFITASYGDNCY